MSCLLKRNMQGQPLKKCYFWFSGQLSILPPGGNFYFHFCNFFFLLSIHTKKEKKKGGENCLRPPDWPQFWPSGGQETNFFLRLAQ